MAQRKAAPLVGLVMGSDSDWNIMRHAATQLEAFSIPYEARVVSAHRMPDDMFEYAEDAAPRGIRVACKYLSTRFCEPGSLHREPLWVVFGATKRDNHVKRGPT